MKTGVSDNHSERKENYSSLLQGRYQESKESLKNVYHQPNREKHFKQEKLSEILARQNSQKESKSRTRQFLETRDKMQKDVVQIDGNINDIECQVDENMNLRNWNGNNCNSQQYVDSKAKETKEIEQLKMEILADFNGVSYQNLSNNDGTSKSNFLPSKCQTAALKVSNSNSHQITSNERNQINHQKDAALTNKSYNLPNSSNVYAAPFFSTFSPLSADMTQKSDIATQTLPNQQYSTQLKSLSQMSLQQQLHKQQNLSISPIRSVVINSSTNYLAISKKLQDIVTNNKRHLMPSVLNSDPTFINSYRHQVIQRNQRHPYPNKGNRSSSNHQIIPLKNSNESTTLGEKLSFPNKKESITVQPKNSSKTHDLKVPLHISLEVSQFRKSTSEKQEYEESNNHPKEIRSGSCKQQKIEQCLQQRIKQKQSCQKHGFNLNQHNNQQEKQQHQSQQNSTEQQLQSSQLLYSAKMIDGKYMESNNSNRKSHSRSRHDNSSSQKKLAFLKSTAKIFSSMNTNNDNINRSNDYDDDDGYSYSSQQYQMK